MSRSNKTKKHGSVTNVILVIAIVVFVFAAVQLIRIQLTYYKGSKEYQELEQYVEIPDNTDKDKELESQEEQFQSESLPENAPKKPHVDFSKLKEINSEIVGWIYVPGVEINYPILQTSNNEYYLKRTFERKSNIAGAIFLETTNTGDFSDPNTLIYGHNMKNGSMFGRLKKLKEQELFQENPYVWVLTPQGDYLYKIFSVFDTQVNSDVYTLYHEQDESYKGYLDAMKEESVVSNEETMKKEDKTIIMSTCTADSNTRCVVFAKRIYEEKR